MDYRCKSRNSNIKKADTGMSAFAYNWVVFMLSFSVDWLQEQIQIY